MSHRSGSLKQQNKPHGKLGHQSKRKRKRALGGRTASEPRRQGGGSKAGSAAERLRDQRANLAKQRRLHHREELLLKRRVGGGNGPPKVVAFLSLSPQADGDKLGLQLVGTAAENSLEGSRSQSVTLRFLEPKLRLTLIRPERSLDGAVEAARVADVVLLLLDMKDGPDGALDDLSEVMLTLLKAQGLPTVVGAVLGVNPKEHTPKVAMAHRTWAKRFFSTEFVDAKVWDSGELNQLVRLLGNAAPKPIHWRDIRSYVLTDNVRVSHNSATGVEGGGEANAGLAPVTLRVEGYVRGRPLNVNRLVHVPNIGTFRLRRILAAKEPCPMPGRAQRGDQEPEDEILAEAEPGKVEPLKMEAEVDNLAGEQTWPTVEEFPELEEEDMCTDGPRTPKQIRRLPKGLTDAQKAWFDFDDDDGHVFGDFDEEEKLGFSDEEYEEVDMGEPQSTATRDAELHVEDLATLSELRMDELERRRLREKEEREFPDEVDTPIEQPARVRFGKYRALKSFRTSPWHKHEALPPDYSRVHGFQDFRHVQKAVLEEMAEAEKAQNTSLRNTNKKHRRSRTPEDKVADTKVDGALDDASMDTTATGATKATKSTLQLDDGETYVPTGVYVALEIVDIPEIAADDALAAAIGLKGTGVPLAISSLLPHENRLSVLHCSVQRLVADKNIGVVHSSEPIKSKDELRFVSGFRTWTARPIFSEVSSGASDKHRFERFLPIGAFVCASTFGPVCYRPSPVMIFRDERDDEGYTSTQLVATGTVDAVDPDRLIIKRLLLTGYPVKVHKRTATVKYMFFNKKDVAWFKPAELSTKHGLIGHIKESLGEQGLMKCAFNEQIKQHDTVCLALYKRVFPKFPQSNRIDVL